MLKNIVARTAMVLVIATASVASGTELITNGGFESAFGGWTVSNQAAGSGSWFVTPFSTTPFSGYPTVGPAAGNFYAVTDQYGGGAHSLSQAFSVNPNSSAILSFDMFINNWNDAMYNGGALNFNIIPNQYGRVDILTADAPPFDTSAGVLTNLFMGGPATSIQNPYTHYSFDITNIVGNGGVFQLRFAEVDNQWFFNMGIDNVSINAQDMAGPVPEPSTLLLLGAGILGVGFLRKRNKA